MERSERMDGQGSLLCLWEEEKKGRAEVGASVKLVGFFECVNRS